MQFGVETGIKKRVIDEICEIARRYDVERVLLFGSRARGEYKERSDIDLACIGGNVDRFILDIEEETYTLLKFDIIDLGRPVDDALLKSIKKDGIVLYEKI